MKRPLVRQVLGWFSAGLFLAGCASMLELDGYDDAVTLLCQCPGFESINDCIDTANTRLAFSNETERQDWLDEFEDKQCGTLCDRADECYGAVPSCREKRIGCECCFWNAGKLSCTTGNCETCKTCFELVTSADNGNQCVSGRALYRPLRECACGQCASQCAGFCQGTANLANNLSDACSMCLSGSCGDSFTACTADKP